MRLRDLHHGDPFRMRSKDVGNVGEEGWTLPDTDTVFCQVVAESRSGKVFVTAKLSTTTLSWWQAEGD